MIESHEAESYNYRSLLKILTAFLEDIFKNRDFQNMTVQQKFLHLCFLAQLGIECSEEDLFVIIEEHGNIMVSSYYIECQAQVQF